MEEIWKDIPNYEGLYQVSNFGNVKSLQFTKEKLLKPTLNKNRYLATVLFKDKKRKNYRIHQLVAIAFLNHKICGFELVVNHKDFNRQNNNLDNLEIVTFRENCNRKHLQSTSKYVGVYFNKQKNKFMARISINGKDKYLGLFENEYDAHIAYQNKLKELI